MRKIITEIKKFHEDEQGDIVQTGIIIGIMAVISVGALVFLGPKIKSMFDKAGGALDQGNATGY